MNKNLTTKRQFYSKHDNKQPISSFCFKPFLRCKCLRILEGHESFVNSVAISLDGKTIVSGSMDKTIKIWDFQSGKCLNTLKGHLDIIGSIKISPDGKTIVSCSYDSIIKIWDIKTQECISTYDNNIKDGNVIDENLVID